ncbi:MAG: beta-galactosidase [Candidatus Yanofskybacteria bacterium]|nr:beta-galactosidase [Candidatus Yanofskybacteria bacterium]
MTGSCDAAIPMKIKKLKILLIAIFLLAAIFYVLSLRPLPETITYGVSFSKLHSDELELDWKETLLAILDDLGVRHVRFSAHWPMVEPEDDKFNFSELDFQMDEARKRNVSVILAVGRRLPGWPECHEPDWLKSEAGNRKSETEAVAYRQEQTLKYIERVVVRYKSYENIKYWQVENEPHLSFFSRSLCGPLDEEFLQKEIALVHKIDPSRQVLITDSGEFGTWYKAYRHHGEVFGTSMYLYVWWKWGPIRYPITPAFFRIKQGLIELVYGKKPKILIELSAEPWLRQPIVGTPNEILLSRMGIDKFNEMIDFASKTDFDTQYLWGAEWWYWLKKNGITDDHWDRAQELFK